MLATAVRRGVAAGLLAGLLAGLVGLAIGEAPIDRAVALEEAAADGDAAAETQGLTRGQQRLGLVAGTVLIGLGVGAVFGVASSWATGRVAGTPWERSLKLGATALYAVVLLPALKYPATPPGAGDRAAVGVLGDLWFGLVVVGFVLAAATWAAAGLLAGTRLTPPVRQTLLGAGLLGATVLALIVLPDAGGSGTQVPAGLLWDFRLRALAVQAVLYGGTAVAFGLLAGRAEQRPARLQRAASGPGRAR